VQQRLSQYLVTKDSLHSNGDKSLEGLVIDWHMAEYDVPSNPISRQADYQPTYAAA
tara:strand:+ start:1070 stop:1237 length:168 start_codon:yes stop_codon:yes gene_type:complete